MVRALQTDVEAAEVRPGLAELVSSDLEAQLAQDEQPMRSTAVDRQSAQGVAADDTPPGAKSQPNAAEPVQLAPTAASNALLERLETAAPYLADRVLHRRSEPIPGHEKNLRPVRDVEGSNVQVMAHLSSANQKLTSALRCLEHRGSATEAANPASAPPASCRAPPNFTPPTSRPSWLRTTTAPRSAVWQRGSASAARLPPSTCVRPGATRAPLHL